MKNKPKSFFIQCILRGEDVKMSEWLSYALLKLRMWIHLNKWNNR